MLSLQMSISRLTRRFAFYQTRFSMDINSNFHLFTYYKHYEVYTIQSTSKHITQIPHAVIMTTQSMNDTRL